MGDDFYCEEALSGRTPVRVVHETESVLAFHHTRPFWPVHVVVVPKAHVPSLTDLGGHPVELVHEVLDVARVVAAEVEREHGACRVLTNLGRYQDSKHLHFHVTSGEPLGHVTSGEPLGYVTSGEPLGHVTSGEPPGHGASGRPQES